MVYREFLTCVIATDEALQCRWVESEGVADKRLIESTLDFTGDIVFDVIDDGIEVAGIRIVSWFIVTGQVT